MQSNVHSHNFEKCVCLAISVSSVEESQLHQALCVLSSRLLCSKRSGQIWIQFSSRRAFLTVPHLWVQSRRISYRWFQGLESNSLEPLLESYSQPHTTFLSPHCFEEVPCDLCLTMNCEQKLCESLLNQVDVLCAYFLSFSSSPRLWTDLKHCMTVVGTSFPEKQQIEESCSPARSTILLFI